jgi:hypothetical protein
MNTQQVTQEDIFKVINTLAIQVRNDLMESEVFEDSDTLETIKTIVFLAQLHNSDWSYPFTEGDTYYTIEHDTIVESVWDEESKELYLSDSNKLYNHSDQQYFSSLDEAVHYFKSKAKTTPKISLL